jgi:hypothetical protein
MWQIWVRGDMHAGFWWGNLKERNFLADPGVEGSIILKWILNRTERCGLDSSCSEKGEMTGCCEYGNEVCGCKKFRYFPEYLRNYWLPKEDSVPWRYSAS